MMAQRRRRRRRGFTILTTDIHLAKRMNCGTLLLQEEVLLGFSSLEQLQVMISPLVVL